MELKQIYHIQDIMNEIDQMWLILNGKKEKKMEIKDLKLAFMCINLDLKEEEIIRTLKDRGYVDKKELSLSEFKDIAIIKIKNKDFEYDIENVIKSFKNKNDIFIRSNIQDIINNNAILELNMRRNSSIINKATITEENYEQRQVSTSEFLPTISDTDLDAITIDDILFFCKKKKIKVNKNEIEEMVTNINIEKKLKHSDINYLYRKTKLI